MPLDGELLRGVAEPVIMKLVSRKPMYGYEIIKVVNARTGGAFEWKEGTLYPCLHRLEGAGLLTSEWGTSESGRRRKYYGITPKGAALLKDKVKEWSAFSEAVNAILLSGARG